MNKPHNNPFQHNPEQVFQERMKHGRRMTREEFFQSAKTPPPSDKDGRDKPSPNR
jgi:hypothetical protein